MKIPRTLGRYEVVDLIGRGGMGALYRARDPRIGRFVAIKQLRPEFDTPELRDRFSREAAAAGSLSHPNIVTIYDVGEDDGLPFIAMEYVRGETFTDILGLRPPLSVMRKLQLMEEVCAGLAHAHEAGIVHRDIKPANLIVGSEGIVKILDFGIAKLSASGLTLPGVILGSLNYMAPEQIRGDAVDARADVFAVGAVLYELVTHRQAFPGRASDEVLDRILRGSPKPIAESYPDVDPRLVDLVDFALQKDPAERIQEIGFLQKELSNIRLRPSVSEPHRTSTRRASSKERQTGLITPLPTPVSGQRPSMSSGRDQAGQRARIDDYLNAAEREFARGNLDAAIESCKQVLMLDDSDERAIAQLDRIHAAFDEQQAVADLAASQEESEAQLRAAVGDARRRFAAGDHQSAIQALEQLEPSSDTLVAATLSELRAAFRQIEDERRVSRERAERRQRLVDTLTKARAAIQNGQLDEGARLIEALRGIDAAAPEVSDVADRLQKAEAAARLKAQVDTIVAEIDAALTGNDLSRASELLTTATVLVSGDPRVQGARSRLDRAVAAVAAKEAAEAQAREAEQRLAEAEAAFESGDFGSAAEQLALATSLAPHHPRLVEFAVTLREATERRAAAEAAERLAQQIRELVASASQRLQSAGDQTNELRLAVREIDQALELGPGNADAVTLKGAIEESIAAHRDAARVKAVVSNARSRFANGKRHAAIRLLEEFQPASHPGIAAALNELRAALEKIEEENRLEQERLKTQQRLAEIFAGAQSAIGEHRFEAALELLGTASDIDPASPELVTLRERIDQGQTAIRVAAELDARLSELDERFASGDLPAATELLAAAADLGPDDQRVQAVRRRLEQAVADREAAAARSRDLEAKHTAARALFDQGDLPGARDLLQLARDIGADQPEIRELNDRVEQAIKVKEESDAAERRRREVEELLAAAAQRLSVTAPSPSDVTSAAQEIEKALALAPDHATALALKATAQEAVAAEQRAAVIRATIRNARTRFANGKHHAALQLLEKLDPATNPMVEETLEELRAALHEIEERRRIEQERLERERQITALIAAARASINGERFAEALDTLSVLRAIDDSAAGLAELTEQATRGGSRQAAAALPAPPEEMSTDSDATRVILIGPGGFQPRPQSVDAARPAPSSEDTNPDDPAAGVGRNQTSRPAASAGTSAGLLPWLVVASAIILLLLVLGALYLLKQPARVGARPTESAPRNEPHRLAELAEPVAPEQATPVP